MSNEKVAVNFTHIDEDSGSNPDEYAFIERKQIPVEDTDDMVSVKVGGIPISVLVDLSTKTNTVHHEIWKKLKQQKIQCTSKKCEKQLFAYGSKEPLRLEVVYVPQLHERLEITKKMQNILLLLRGSLT